MIGRTENERRFWKQQNKNKTKCCFRANFLAIRNDPIKGEVRVISNGKQKQKPYYLIERPRRIFVVLNRNFDNILCFLQVFFPYPKQNIFRTRTVC